MRIAISPNRRERGNTLLVSVFTLLIVGLALIVYLQLGTNENQLVVRSQVWNACMPVLEAGIEEALEHCSVNSSNMQYSGWALAGNTYSRSNTVGDGFWLARISTNQPFTITSSGYYPMPGSSFYVSRTVRVTTTNMPVYKMAMFSKTTINMNGNKVRVDSYDSRDPAKSTNGQYDPAKAGDKGDVGCLTSKSSFFNIQNADIWGHAYVEAGGGVSTGPNGHVGSVAWQATPGGIQAGWLRTDLNVSIPDVAAPFPSAVPPMPGTVDGNSYDYVFTSGNYMMATLDKNAAVTGDAVVYVTGNISSQLLYIRTNASVRIYGGGLSASFNTISNTSADSLMYFGLPSNKILNLGGSWVGAVYAPSADFVLAGSAQLSGSLTANSIQMSGTSGFHYDEALGAAPVGRGFVITSWTEL